MSLHVFGHDTDFIIIGHMTVSDKWNQTPTHEEAFYYVSEQNYKILIGSRTLDCFMYGGVIWLLSRVDILYQERRERVGRDYWPSDCASDVMCLSENVIKLPVMKVDLACPIPRTQHCISCAANTI